MQRPVELETLLSQDQRKQEILAMGYETLLSLIGIGKYHYYVILCCALSNAADAVEIVAISFVISASKDDLGMDSFDEGVLTSIIFLGMMFGGWIWGSMADQAKYGRKKILFYSLLINGIFGLLSVVAVDFYMLVVLRFCSGLGVGGSIPVTFTYAAEFLPKEKRGMFLALLAVSWPFAATLTSLFAYAIIPHVETITLGSISIESWRIFLIPCCIPAFFASFIFYKYVDPSPKFLIYTRHQYSHASKLLTRIAKKNGIYNGIDDAEQIFHPDTLRSWVKNQNVNNPDAQLLPPQMIDDELSLAKLQNTDITDHPASVIINDPYASPNVSTDRSSFMSKFSKVLRKTGLLFEKEHRNAHILCSVVWFTLSFGFYGLSEWLPTYFGSKSDIDEYTSAILTSAAQFPGAILTCWMVEYCCDRKLTLSISIGLGAITIIGVPYLNNGSEIVATLCVFNGVTVCAWSALDVVSTELSPTFIRSTAYGFFAACGRIGAIGGNLTFGLFGQDDIAGALTVCGIVLVVGTASCLLLPSTKGKAIQ